MEPLISVIIPVYNVKNYLQRCVQSVTGQTYKKLEIILIDDGSADGSGTMCDDLAGADSRVRVVHQENSGLSAARNRGIKESNGDYIALVDSDDFIRENMFEIMLRKMLACDADIALCGYSKWIEKQESIVDSGVKFEETVLKGEEALELLFREEYSVLLPVAWNKLYKRTVWDGLQYPPGKKHEDEHVIHRLLHRCKKVAMVPENLYVYSIRDGSIMATRTLKASRDWIEALLDRVKFYELTGNEPLARKQRERCIHMILWECKKINTLSQEAKTFMREMAEVVRGLAENCELRYSKKVRAFVRFPVLYSWLGRRLL